MSPGHIRRGERDSRGLALEAVDVHKRYEHDGVSALDGATLSVAAGEWVALVGPSGAGKSTLLHLFAGLDVPSTGSVIVGGQNLAGRRRLAAYRRFEVGLVFQLHNLLAHLNAERNIEVVMFGTARSRSERRQRARELLELLDLGPQSGRKPPELSGGERQRVAIARALANDPRVLLADEPTGSLDPENVKLVSRLLEELHGSGTTIVMVTHDEEMARRADRVIELRNGRVIDPEATTAQAASAT